MTVSEDPSATIRKCIRLNSGQFSVPLQVHHLPMLSLPEKTNLVDRLRLELEHIHILQKKMESRCINETGLSSSNFILSYGNDLKDQGLKGASSSLFDPIPLQRVATPGNSMRMAMKPCETLLELLMAHNYAHVFSTPVDVVKWNIPDYYTIIKQPMDLGTVKGKFASGEYLSAYEFVADIRLIFTNAMTYNPPKNDVHIMAKTLSKFFEVRWRNIEKKLPHVHPEPVPAPLGIPQNTDASGLMPPLKKRKIPAMQHNSVSQPVQKIMTTEEKHCLTRELESILGELPEGIINFLKEHCSNGAEAGEDEIEIDLDVLSDETLFELQKLLDDYLKQKQKNNNKMAEPCEIELLHGSGISNSSMQAGKGNEAADEEIDIGGLEPVSSYPPVEIDRDLCQRSESGRGLDQEAQNLEPSVTPVESKCEQDVGRQLSPEKLYRAALLKSRFADTILKAREKTLNQVDKGDPEKLHREREELELQKRKEKARLQAEAKAAEDARKRAEAEAAAEAKKKRELEREAARQALLQMEKSVEINGNCLILEDLEKLRTGPGEHLPSSVDETSLDHAREGMGGFRFGGTNPLEQLGLFMKEDDEDEEAESSAMPNGAKNERSPDHAQGMSPLGFGGNYPLKQLGLFLKEDVNAEEADPPNMPTETNDETNPDPAQEGMGGFGFEGSNALKQLGLFMKEDKDEAEPPSMLNGVVDEGTI